jgi:hypothetical protein
MAKVLNSISLDDPASPVTADVNDTFAFTGSPGFAGGGGVQRYDFKWEVNLGLGFFPIGASGTGLITADTNPLENSNSQTQNSITVTCDEAGSYTIRMVGAPSTGGSYTVVSATETVEVSAAAGTDDLLADDVATGTPTLTSAAIGQAHVLSADDVATDPPTLTSAALGQVHALTADDVAAAAPTLSTPALAEAGGDDELTADDIAAGQPTLTSAALGQVHVLTASGLATGAAELGMPEIGQAHVLTAQDVAAGAPTLGSPSIAQIHGLAADDVDAGTPALGTPALSESADTDALEADGIVAGTPSPGTPAIGQEHVLTASGVAGSVVLGSPVIGQVHVLSGTALSAGTPAMGDPQLNAPIASTDRRASVIVSEYAVGRAATGDSAVTRTTITESQ